MHYLPILSQADLHERLLMGRTREDHWLDFRREPHTRREDCARDVAQFANASGGVLVIGADEADHVFKAWQTVSNPHEYIRWVDEVVKGHLTPVPVVEPVTMEATSGEIVVVLNIPPSLVLIARRDGDAFEFPIRAVDSRRYMTLLEVEARMQNKERAMRLRIEQIPPEAAVRLDAVLVTGIEVLPWKVAAVDDNAVVLSKSGLKAEIPLTYVEAVYQTHEDGAAWVIGLSCHVQGVPGGTPRFIVVKRYNVQSR